MDARKISGLLTALMLVAVAGSAAAAPSGRRATPLRATSPLRSQTTDTERRIDINNLNMFVSNIGAFGYDLAGDFNGGLFYPKGTDRTAIFASGLWLGAVVRDTVRVTVAEYDQEYRPGRIIGGVPEPPGNSRLIVYKMVRFSGDPADTAHVVRDPDTASGQDALVHHSWSEYINGAAPYGAPTRTYRLDNTATPAPGDSVNVLGPDVIGDMMLWTVYNDGDPDAHTNSAGNSRPLGIQIEQTTFAFDRQGPLGNTIFIKYKFKNAGADTLKEMYVSQWSDPDLGGFTDDLVGCDTTLSLGYVYNATNNDQAYGSTPPAVGYDFFKGPRVGATTLGLSSFAKYVNGTDPSSPDETYHYMSGYDGAGDPIVDPFGTTTTYMHAGDPISPSNTSWLDSSPADRRFFMSSGPFTMSPGDSQEVVVAIIVGQGSNRLSSISALRFADQFAQAAFDSSFNLPSPPPAPKISASTDHGTVTLSWDAASRNNYVQPGYRFEGYNVYQGASVSGPWTLIATYDEVNNVRVVFDKVFDPATGQLIPEFPTAFGSDAGIRFQHVQTQDAVRGGPLRDGTEYFFAVTAYGHNPTGLPKVLENSQSLGSTIVRVIPQRPAAGTDLSTASVDSVLYLRKDGTKPPSTDVVSVEVVNPELLTGHIYKVSFQDLTPPYVGPIGQIANTTIFHSWTVTDSTTNEVKLTGQLNRNGDDDYKVVDGLRFVVNGKYSPQLQDAAYQNLNTAHRRAIAGVNWGGAFFGGGADAAINFPGADSSIDPVANPDSFSTVEFRFGSPGKAYRYLRFQDDVDGSPPPQGRVYQYAGYKDINVQAWDTVANRQLALLFTERLLTDVAGNILPDAQQSASLDSVWLPTDEGDGGREYLMVSRRPYTATADPALTVNDVIRSSSQPNMWFLWSSLRSASEVIDSGDKFKFTWASPAKTNDVYVVHTSKLKRSNASLAASKLDAIRAVPNPYYARSNYELNQFTRRIRFLNMPEQCTVRIYNLAGQLVRTLEKTDPASSLLEWNLETRNNLPVASGIYICHIDVPGVGERVTRIAVFMEKERLNNF